jgi:uncharacterized lipoprotein YbaY
LAAQGGEGASVAVRVHFEAGDEPPKPATVLVRIEEVSRADAPSRVVAEGRCVVDRGSRTQLLLHRPAIDHRAHYSVRVHVDIDGDGEPGVGDYVSSQSHPVLTYGAPTEVDVLVRRIH